MLIARSSRVNVRTVTQGGRDAEIADSSARLDFERRFLWLRLTFLLTPIPLLLAYGWSAALTTVLIAVAVAFDCAVAGVLLLRFPEQVLRMQLGLRLLDLGIGYVVLHGVYSFAPNVYYNCLYLLFVVAATATHGRRGTLSLSALAAMAVLTGRLQLVAEGAVGFEARYMTDTIIYGLLFVVTGYTTSFLIRRSQDALVYQALHDPLTDLPNRTLLRELLEQAINLAARQRMPLGLMLIDLDRFKEINDTFGHRYGDLVLQEVGTRLTDVLRASDVVARLGGDEFAVLLSHTDGPGTARVAGRILAALAVPFELDGQILHTEGSIGIAPYPEAGADVDTLLRHADVAMYVAKREQSGYAVYDPAQDRHSADRLALLADLRRAIAGDQLLLYYQPKVDLRTGSVMGVEALARWQHPKRGMMVPDQFIPLAEEAGLIEALTFSVLTQAVHQMCLWEQAGLETAVAVNLSAETLRDRHLAGTISRLLRTSAVAPARLILEITESALIANPDLAMETLTRLHEMGVGISIDDFGTGYSSLGYLERLPVDQIKIDRSFVLGMAVEEHKAVIVRAITELSHNLGLEVVAEGVEDEQTLETLTAMGCDAAQGYYLSRPCPPGDCAIWLREYGCLQNSA